MSLNWREIDRLLDELRLPGCLVQQVHQPSRDALVFELRTRGGGLRLLVSLATAHARLHRLTRAVANPRRPPRFAAFLRAHVRGGRIAEARQVGGERIVRLAVERADETCVLWIRLWPTAANVIVTRPDGRILDAFHRRPSRGEVAGGSYDADVQFRDARPPRDVSVRDLPGEGDFNARVEEHYRLLEEREEADRLRTALLAALKAREAGILVQKQRLEKQLEALADPGRLRELGDIIMANLHRIGPQAQRLEAEDFHNQGAPIVITLDPRMNGPANAQSYYERASAARRGAQRVAEELAVLDRALAEVTARRAAVEAETSLEALRGLRGDSPRRGRRTMPPGLRFASLRHRILVGRTAAENDALLRSHVAGNDYWFHSRDWPGAYVFVKTPQGKSVPLDVMLDAANLAVFYSKGREVGSGDVYYTQVKHLRRARGGKAGLVIPTREKNLFVRLDLQRIERVRGTAAVE